MKVGGRMAPACDFTVKRVLVPGFGVNFFTVSPAGRSTPVSLTPVCLVVT